MALTTAAPVDPSTATPPHSHVDFLPNEGPRRLTSRANILRQAGASLLRTSSTTPLLPKKLSGVIGIVPELAEPGEIAVFYCTGWDKPFIHYKSSESLEWTKPPGHAMTRTSNESLQQVKSFLPEGIYLDSDSVWSFNVPNAENLEFVLNNNGSDWDKPCHGGNYFIESSGQFFLKSSNIHAVIPPPEHPALLEASSITACSVSLVWNGPIARLSDVSGYQIFRNDIPVVSLDEKTFIYEDRDLNGLTKYVYTVKAINKNGVLGAPSDRLEVTTGEPGKPSEVQNLTVSDHSDTFIELTWQKPYDTGGGAIEIYRIYRNCIPVGFKPCTANKWESWRDTKVEAKKSYMYHITACRYLPPRGEVATFDPTEASRTAKNAVNRLASRLCRLPSMPLNPPSSDSGIQTLTDYLVAVIHDRDYEGLVAKGVEAKAVSRVVIPRLGDRKTHIILQGFNWHSCENPKGHYNALESEAEKMKSAGITMLWLPPPTESVAPQGYMPTRWHNLNSAYGKEEDLRRLIEKLKNNGVVPMLDFVANHRCGVRKDDKGGWTIFEDPDWGSWAIVSNNKQGYTSRGAVDTGASSECAPDLDHTNGEVRRDIKEWIKWLFETVGFGALRIDMAPGYATKFQVEYVQSLGNPFTVGEYWSGDSHALHNYTNAGRGSIAAYDFALYYILRRAVETGNFSELSDGGRVAGLLGKDPQRAVTFIDNHDTVHLDFVGKFAGWNRDAVLRGYVYLLTHPGTPCLYLDHCFDFGDWFFEKLVILGKTRHEANLTSESGVLIASAKHGLYAAYISRDRCSYPENAQVAMKLGSEDWCPQGDKWKVRTFGNDFCVWTKC